jgi:hypothetical protein
VKPCARELQEKVLVPYHSTVLNELKSSCCRVDVGRLAQQRRSHPKGVRMPVSGHANAGSHRAPPSGVALRVRFGACEPRIQGLVPLRRLG